MSATLKAFIFGTCLLTAPVVFAQAPVSNSEQQGGSVEQRLERIERMLQSQGLVNILQQLQELQREVSTLRGDIETQNYNLEQLARRQRDLYTDIDQRLQRLEGTDNAVSAEIVIDSSLTAQGPEGPPLETLSATQNLNGLSTGIPSSSSLQVEVINSVPQASPETVTAAGITAAETGAITGAPGPVAGVNPVIAAQTTTSVDPVQLQAEYQQAFNLLRQSLYDQAIKAFQQFLTAHPDDRYSDSAQYWLAEAYYVKREYQLALPEYNKVITNFPQSQKVSDAMLKIGFTLYELGQLDAAKQQLQTLIQKQPDSTVARMADEKLKQINTLTPQDNPTSVN